MILRSKFAQERQSCQLTHYGCFLKHISPTTPSLIESEMLIPLHVFKIMFLVNHSIILVSLLLRIYSHKSGGSYTNLFLELSVAFAWTAPSRSVHSLEFATRSKSDNLMPSTPFSSQYAAAAWGGGENRSNVTTEAARPKFSPQHVSNLNHLAMRPTVHSLPFVYRSHVMTYAFLLENRYCVCVLTFTLPTISPILASSNHAEAPR